MGILYANEAILIAPPLALRETLFLNSQFLISISACALVMDRAVPAFPVAIVNPSMVSPSRITLLPEEAVPTLILKQRLVPPSVGINRVLFAV